MPAPQSRSQQPNTINTISRTIQDIERDFEGAAQAISVAQDESAFQAASTPYVREDAMIREMYEFIEAQNRARPTMRSELSNEAFSDGGASTREGFIQHVGRLRTQSAPTNTPGNYLECAREAIRHKKIVWQMLEKAEQHSGSGLEESQIDDLALSIDSPDDAARFNDSTLFALLQTHRR